MRFSLVHLVQIWLSQSNTWPQLSTFSFSWLFLCRVLLSSRFARKFYGAIRSMCHAMPQKEQTCGPRLGPLELGLGHKGRNEKQGSKKDAGRLFANIHEMNSYNASVQCTYIQRKAQISRARYLTICPRQLSCYNKIWINFQS